MAGTGQETVVISRTEPRVRFDEEPSRKEKATEDQEDQEDQAEEGLCLQEVAAGEASPSKEKQLYANEGISRL